MAGTKHLPKHLYASGIICCFLVIVAWADNADACSNQYAGTGALKTDFTRYIGDVLKICVLIGYVYNVRSGVPIFMNSFAQSLPT